MRTGQAGRLNGLINIHCQVERREPGQKPQDSTAWLSAPRNDGWAEGTEKVVSSHLSLRLFRRCAKSHLYTFMSPVPG